MSQPAGERWREIADRVWVRRYPLLDLNISVIAGGHGCLVVDTRASAVEGEQLAASVRALTPLPWAVVNTHAHYDHCFGNAAFRPAQVWAHQRCAEVLAGYAATQARLVAHMYQQAGHPDLADEVMATRVDLPDRLFTDAAELDLGDRPVRMWHPGRGHTDSDIVIEAAGVLFAGDLVEQGAPPAYADGFPLDWPDTLARLATPPGPVVPGHGEVVDAGFVRAQHADIATVADLTRAAFADNRPAAAAAAEITAALGWEDRHARPAVDRAYRQMRGEPAYDTPAAILTAAGLAPTN
jgi:glyoxylase-like metal-dependent hydrolase (beta-lactamase superfamily II)